MRLCYSLKSAETKKSRVLLCGVRGCADKLGATLVIPEQPQSRERDPLNALGHLRKPPIVRSPGWHSGVIALVGSVLSIHPFGVICQASIHSLSKEASHSPPAGRALCSVLLPSETVPYIILLFLDLWHLWPLA